MRWSPFDDRIGTTLAPTAGGSAAGHGQLQGALEALATDPDDEVICMAVIKAE